MCWGVPAILLEIDRERGLAKVDFGDGIARETLVGVTSDELKRGDIVIVHAGVIISTIDERGLTEMYTLLSSLVSEIGGEGEEDVKRHFEHLIRLSEELRG